MNDRRAECGTVGMQVAIAYERAQSAEIDDTHDGEGPDGLIERALREIGTQHIPGRLSADIISRRPAESLPRVIEVKARSTSGPVSIQERELNTLLAAAENGWLYVVWNALQTPDSYHLHVIRDPGRSLTWTLERPSPRWRPPGCRHDPVFRGGQHELEYSTTVELINKHDEIELDGVPSTSQ